MTTIVQVEFREDLLSIRDEILQSLGHPVISALGSPAARTLDLSHERVGVVLIGHGAPWKERCNLAAHFQRMLPRVPIVASLRQRDEDVTGADYKAKGPKTKKAVCEWLDAVYEDLDNLSKVWFEICEELESTTEQRKIDEALGTIYRGHDSTSQLAYSGRLLEFYHSASEVLGSKQAGDFHRNFVDKLGSVLDDRRRARAILDKELEAAAAVHGQIPISHWPCPTNRMATS